MGATLIFQFVLAIAFLYFLSFTWKELWPGRMSPQSCFSEAFEIVRYNHEVLKITGENMRGYGKDFGSKTEGRRNHVDEYKYTDEDNIERLRVRFNAKGKRGHVVVWAEVG